MPSARTHCTVCLNPWFRARVRDDEDVGASPIIDRLWAHMGYMTGLIYIPSNMGEHG